MTPGLTALGTAAVLGIYAAGFTLTRDAAHGLEGIAHDASGATAFASGPEEDVGAIEGPATGDVPPAELSTGATAGDGPSLGSAAASDSTAQPVGSPVVATLGAGPTAGVTARPSSSTTEPAAPATTVSTGGPSSAGPDSPTASAAPVPVGSAGPSVAAESSRTRSGAGRGRSQTASQPATSETPVPPSTATAAEPAAESAYLDGLYTARGIRTGHGDIEATVEIAGGRIVSASVSRCRMRWPCTDVDPMIPRMIRAQSPGVPVISGATQSSDAFSTAVTEALALARAAKTSQSSGQ